MSFRGPLPGWIHVASRADNDLGSRPFISNCFRCMSTCQRSKIYTSMIGSHASTALLPAPPLTLSDQYATFVQTLRVFPAIAANCATQTNSNSWGVHVVRFPLGGNSVGGNWHLHLNLGSEPSLLFDFYSFNGVCRTCHDCCCAFGMQCAQDFSQGFHFHSSLTTAMCDFVKALRLSLNELCSRLRGFARSPI